MSIQKIVADLRAAGLSDESIAASVGCAQSTLSMWANGHRGKKSGDYLLRLFTLHTEKCPPQKTGQTKRTGRT